MLPSDSIVKSLSVVVFVILSATKRVLEKVATPVSLTLKTSVYALFVILKF
jgi:hypothetical protein